MLYDMLYIATLVLGRANGGLHEMLAVERSIKEEDKAAFGGNESVKKNISIAIFSVPRSLKQSHA